MTVHLVPIPTAGARQTVRLFGLRSEGWLVAMEVAEHLATPAGARCVPSLVDGALTFELSGPDVAVEAVVAALVAWAERRRRAA